MDKYDNNFNDILRNVFQDPETTAVALLNSLRDSITIMNDQGEIIFWNDASERLFGYTREEAIGNHLIQLLDQDQSDCRQQISDVTKFCRSDEGIEDGKIIRLTGKHKNHRLMEIELSLSKVFINPTFYVAGMIRDVSDSVKDRRDLEITRQEYIELADKSPIGIVSCDGHGTILYVNQTALNILGSPNIEETKKINLFTFPSLVESGFSKKLKESIQDRIHVNYEENYESKWGKKIWLRIHIKPFQHGDSVGAQIIIDDITDRKNLESQLFSYSYTDALTGTYNRRYLMEKLELALAGARKAGEVFSLIMIDLDHFKKINDSFGHNIGDFVLKTTVSVLIGGIRRKDTLARWGGEEFFVLLPKASIEQAVEISERLRESLSQVKLPDVERLTASFGVTSYREGDTADQIIHRADRLMYQAKKSGRNCVEWKSKRSVLI